MVAIIVGVLMIFFAVAASISCMLGWGVQIIAFLKGCAPVLAALIGLLSIFIGIADIKDKREAKREEENQQN